MASGTSIEGKKTSSWIVRYAWTSPPIIAIVTWMLRGIVTSEWQAWVKIEVTAGLVDLAALIYGVSVVILEGGSNMVWWALEQRKGRRAKIKEEGQEEVFEQLLETTPEDQLESIRRIIEETKEIMRRKA